MIPPRLIGALVLASAVLLFAAPAAASSADQARQAAREILEEQRFQKQSHPRPLRGVLEAIDDAIEPIREWLAEISIGGPDFSIGIPRAVLILLALLVAAMVLVQATRVTQRALERRDPRVGQATGEVVSEDPTELERAAIEAERRGDGALALRLRFRAGMLRLNELGAIRLEPSLTARSAARQVGSRDLEGLCLDFEAVTYGGRSARDEQLDAARTRWPRLLSEVKERVAR